VLPTTDAEARTRVETDVEGIAVRVAWGFEEARGATVTDVSTPAGAVAAGLTEHPGFDLLSRHPDGDRLIEVKGKAGTGEVDLTENEFGQACNLRDRFWLYVVYECASPAPRLARVCDPVRTLVARAERTFSFGPAAIQAAASNAAATENA